jgi:tetratricopeptide (TPR) repeat protein
VADNPRIEELRRRVQKDPASIAFAQLAEEFRRAGHYDDAVDVCRAGLERHPSYLSARVTLGRALIELERFDEAAEELNLVLQSAPENLAAIRGLAEIHQRRGDLGEALKQYQSALGIAKHDPEIEESVHALSRQLGTSVETEASSGAASDDSVAEPPPIPIDIPFTDAINAAVAADEATPVSSSRVMPLTSPGLEAAADEFTKALEALSELSIELPETALSGGSLDLPQAPPPIAAPTIEQEATAQPDLDPVAEPVSATEDDQPRREAGVLGRLQSWLSAIVSDREARAGSR